MLDGFIRVAAASPKVRVGDVDYNVSQTVQFAKKAAGNDCAVIVFPELGITGYTCGDLFLQNALLDKAIDGLYDLAEQTADLNTVISLNIIAVKHYAFIFPSDTHKIVSFCCTHGIVMASCIMRVRIEKSVNGESGTNWCIPSDTFVSPSGSSSIVPLCTVQRIKMFTRIRVIESVYGDR